MAESSLLLLRGETDVFVDMENLLRVEDEASILELLMELRLFGINSLPFRDLRPDDFDFDLESKKLGFPIKLRRGEILAYIELKFHQDVTNILQNGVIISFIGRITLPFFPRPLFRLKDLESLIVQVDQGCEIETENLEIKSFRLWRVMIHYGRRSWPSDLYWLTTFKSLEKLVVSIQGTKKYYDTFHPLTLCNLKNLRIAKFKKVDLVLDHSDLSLQRLALINSKVEFTSKPIPSLKSLELQNCITSLRDFSSVAPNLRQLRLGHMRGWKGMGIAKLNNLQKLSLTQVRLIYPR